LFFDNPIFHANLRNPQSLNKYQYCYNNPLLYIDPDGHQGVREWFRNTLNGAASTVSENNGFGRMDAPQTKTGRAIGHVISLAQAGAEIYAGVVGASAGGTEAVVTSPACGTGVNFVDRVRRIRSHTIHEITPSYERTRNKSFCAQK